MIEDNKFSLTEVTKSETQKYTQNVEMTNMISDISIKEGDKIIVLDGPLDGLLGQIKKINLHKRLVTVGFTMCNRPVEAELSINIVTNVVNK